MATYTTAQHGTQITDITQEDTSTMKPTAKVTVKAGAYVNIYLDPITETDREGLAVIVALYPGDYDRYADLHLGRVRFRGESNWVLRRFKTCNVITAPGDDSPESR